MKPNTLTMSALPRTFLCPSSAVLPWTNYSNEYNESGTTGHSEMESAVLNWELDKLPPEVAPLIAGYKREQVMVERTLYYNYVDDTARLSDKIKDCNYRPLPFEIGGTSDVMAFDVSRKRGLVVDWKQFEEVGSAIDNSQTLGYAVGLARVFGLEEVTVVIAYLSPQNRHVDVAVIDDLDFAKYAERLRDLNAIVAGAQQDPAYYLRTGRQCRWCPAFFDCPKQQQLKLEMQADDAIDAIDRLSLDDDDEALKAYDFHQRLGVLVKRLRDAVYARAARRPIPLVDGRFLGKVQKQGNRELDADTVYAVVKAKHGQEVADKAVERVATFTKLTAALKTTGAKSVTKAEAEIVAAVEQQGGVSRKTTTTIEVTTADKLLVARPVGPEVLDAANALLKEAV